MTDLRRHVPRVVLTWDDEAPGAPWRVIDGTLVFADISGFTALTEKLSKRGRIGAEEIVETLNRVFGGMLDTAFARGADLLKFGGDALLLMFRGEGHAERACDAVVEMRVALREAAAVPTSVGRLRLNMSVGVHSGDVHLFLVGEPTRELVVLGPAATSTADAEKSANAGEIVVSAGTAERLAPGATRTRDDGALLLRRRKPSHPAGRTAPLPNVDGARLATLFPLVLGEYLNPGAPEPEHRLATIGFIRVSGTDRRLADDGPDAVAGAMHSVVTRLEECLAAESVTLLSTDLGSDGAGFFLGSGVPQASEDNEGRMLRALRRFVDSDLPLPVQAGCNRGHVFAAEVGASTRAAYSAMGDTTNTAARIMSKATPGLLYAHPAVLQHSRTLFTNEPAGPFQMKGKAQPLLVYSVGEEAGTRESVEEGRLPLLGRDEELAAVRDLLGGAVSGAGGVLTITGGTGMGKTRLVREAVAALDDVTVLTVRAEPYGASSSYRVFRDPVRQLLGIERDTAAAMGQQLLTRLAEVGPDLIPMSPLLADVAQVEVPGTPEADAIDPQYRPERLADTLIDLVARTFQGPLILIAEETHWADTASAQLLRRIAAATSERPWAVVAVRRGTEGGFLPTQGTTIDLGPLPDDVIERLVIEATEATPLRPHEVQAIVDRAEGNPLFIEEATKVARASGSVDQMPQSLQAALAAQIDLLDPVSRRILRYASVLGRSFRREIINETLAADGMSVDPATLARLSEFLEADGADRLRFRNTLLRDAAYEELAYRTRTRLHRAAGLAIERLSTDLDADAPTLSLHFSRAGDDERTWKYGILAGDVARRSYANVDAAAQYQLALGASRGLAIPLPERIACWSVLAEVCWLATMVDPSIAAYRCAVELAADDPILCADLLVRRARVQGYAGSYRTALRTLTRARRIVDPISSTDADRVRARVDCVVAFVRVRQERLKDARAHALRAAEGARLVGDAATLEEALIFVDQAEVFMGLPADGGHTREALAISLAHGWKARESVARNNLGNFAFWAGRWQEAVEAYRLSSTAAVEAGNIVGAADTDVNTGEVLVLLGRDDEAEPVLRGCARVLRASGVEFAATYAEMQLARVHLRRGELDRAEEEIARVSEAFVSLGESMFVMEASFIWADIASASGRPDRALEILEEAEEADAKGDVQSLRARLRLGKATALLGLGRFDECRVELAAGLEAAREQKLPYEEAQLIRVSASLAERLGDDVESKVLVREAERLMAALTA